MLTRQFSNPEQGFAESEELKRQLESSLFKTEKLQSKIMNGNLDRTFLRFNPELIQLADNIQTEEKLTELKNEDVIDYWQSLTEDIKVFWKKYAKLLETKNKLEAIENKINSNFGKKEIPSFGGLGNLIAEKEILKLEIEKLNPTQTELEKFKQNLSKLQKINSSIESTLQDKGLF